MGWTEYTASHYTNKGVVDRKAECDAYFEQSLNRGWYRIVKATMKGSVYYAAVMQLKRYARDINGDMIKDVYGNYVIEDIPERERTVDGVVVRTYVRGHNFGYRVIGETCGPCECNAPKSVLMALSPTKSEMARNWRQQCWDNLNKLKPCDLAVGTVIKFQRNGKEWVLVKQNPAYQFKTPWWSVCDSSGEAKYYSKKRIPDDFEIVK